MDGERLKAIVGEAHCEIRKFANGQECDREKIVEALRLLNEIFSPRKSFEREEKKRKKDQWPLCPNCQTTRISKSGANICGSCRQDEAQRAKRVIWGVCECGSRIMPGKELCHRCKAARGDYFQAMLKRKAAEKAG